MDPLSPCDDRQNTIIKLMEATPIHSGVYKVSLARLEFAPSNLVEFIHNVWLETDGKSWFYEEYHGTYVVCFVHERKSTWPLKAL